MLMEIPKGLCQCGCGERTRLAPANNVKSGWIRGEPLKYHKGHKKKMEHSCHWKGGRKVNSQGYVLIYMPGHHRSGSSGYVREHVLVIEQALGKDLPPGAVGHHIDGNGGNNKNSNLVACENDQYHHLLHLREKALLACGHVSWRKCCYCKEYDDPINLHISTKPSQPVYHASCRNLYKRKHYHPKKG